MTYATKALTVTIQLGKGSFGAGGTLDTITLTNHRVIAQVSTVVNTTLTVGGQRIILRIYGMTLAEMNQLTVAGLQWDQERTWSWSRPGTRAAR